MSEFDEALGSMATPVGQAWGDYINGENGENNPYTEGSEYHKEYSAEMKRLLGELK